MSHFSSFSFFPFFYFLILSLPLLFSFFFYFSFVVFCFHVFRSFSILLVCIIISLNYFPFFPLVLISLPISLCFYFFLSSFFFLISFSLFFFSLLNFKYVRMWVGSRMVGLGEAQWRWRRQDETCQELVLHASSLWFVVQLGNRPRDHRRVASPNLAWPLRLVNRSLCSLTRNRVCLHLTHCLFVAVIRFCIH